MRCALLPLLDAMAWTLGRLPQRAVLALGRALAVVGGPWLRSRRRIARTNVDLCFPALDVEARRRLADASVTNTVTGVLEMVRAWHAPSARLSPLATVEGVDHLRAALQRGGVMLVSGHQTHLEMTLRLIADALGRRPYSLVRRHNDACVERWIDRSRRRVLDGTIGKKDVRGLLRTLRDGHVVAYLGDQDFSYGHAFVPFFGVPAATGTALPDLARRGGATVIPCWSKRDARGHYRVRIGAPWDGWPSGDATQDAARYMAELEAAVREAPEQYLWVHRRFKTRPPGAAPVYGA